MNKLKNILYSLITLLGLMIGCTQIFEEDISKIQLNVISPSNNVQTPYYNQTFWWDKIDGATHYRLQIVSPSFDSLQLLVLDTTCTGDKFTYTLKPGTYQWRMRAENYNYTTEYVVRDIIIDTASLDLQYPSLSAPVNNYVSANTSFDFSWIPIFGASKYYIEIDQASGNFVTPVKKDSTTNSYYTHSLTTDGDYKWRVRGTDGSVHTSWSDVFYFELDRTKPDTITLNSPLESTSSSSPVPTPVTFDWAGEIDVAYYKLYLYKSDGLTIYSTSYPILATTTTTTIQTITSGATVYWTVTAVDKAGNESVPAPKRKLRVQ